jgi:carbon monoxide dehydrogenase subunit G
MGKLEKANDHQTSARIELSAELSPMLKMMVSGPLQNLVNIMADRLVTAFKSQT